jgi:hypothetical protein
MIGLLLVVVVVVMKMSFPLLLLVLMLVLVVFLLVEPCWLRPRFCSEVQNNAKLSEVTVGLMISQE